MITVVCDDCHEEFDSEHFNTHACRAPQSSEPAALPAGVVGPLGMDPEAAERMRIRDLAQAPMAGETLPAVPVKSREEIATMDEGLKTALLVRPVVREMQRQIQQTVDELRHDIQSNTNMLKGMDVPLEQVANSHERAASSFENLRAEIEAVAARQRVLEEIIDTAGLSKAMSRAEERMSTLAAAIRLQFTETSKNMAEVLRLLQKLQDRDLDSTRKRMNRGARRAVSRARHATSS